MEGMQCLPAKHYKVNIKTHPVTNVVGKISKSNCLPLGHIKKQACEEIIQAQYERKMKWEIFVEVETLIRTRSVRLIFAKIVNY